MRLNARVWNSTNFLRLGARIYTQLSDNRTLGHRDAKINSCHFYKPNDSGTGSGGCGSGSIRQSGGVFGKRQAALEEQYFLKKQQQLLQRLRDRLKARKKKGNKKNPRGEKNDNFKDLE